MKYNKNRFTILLKSIFEVNMLRTICCVSFLFIAELANGTDFFHYLQSQNDIYQSFKNINLPFDANTVNTVFQDRYGMMWFGTKSGLCSYNGYDLHEYKFDKLPDGNCVYAIVQMDEEHLCLGTDHGLLWFNLRAEKYEDSYQDLVIRKAIRSIALFDDKLWIGTRDEGLYYYDCTEGRIEKKELSQIHETLIYALEPVGDKLFIGAYEALSYYDTKKGERKQISFPEQSNIMVNSLLWDEKRSCVWIGTEGFLFKYDIAEDKIEKQTFLTGISIKSLAIDNTDNLLMGTDDGLYIYDFIKKAYKLVVHDSRNIYSLCNNVIWDIVCDREKNIWIATDHGISLASVDAEYRYIHLSEIVPIGDGNSFTAMYIDSLGDYWLGGDNGLIHVSSRQNSPFAVKWFKTKDGNSLLKHNRIRYIYEDRERNIWIATDGSIARYDRKADKFVYYTIQDDSGTKNTNWSYSIYEDGAGRLWIATYMGGLFIIDKAKLVAHDSDKPFKEIAYHLDEKEGLDRIIYQMYPDNQGYMWVNTQKGLASIHMESLEVSLKNVFMDNMIYAGQSIWYSSQGKLFHYDVLKDQTTQIPYSTESKYIYSFVQENDRLWLSSTTGLACLDMNTNRVYSTYFFKDCYLSGIYDTMNSVIWWGGKDGLTCFFPKRIKTEKANNPVYITAISSNGVLLCPNVDYGSDNPRYQKTIRLTHIDNITLELSTYSYFEQKKDVFYYQINDEESWHTAEHNHVVLTRPASGKHILKISSTNPLDDMDASVNQYVIMIPYPWYARWYAYVIYLFLLSGIVWWIVRDMQKRNREKYEQREKEKSLELSKLKMDFFVDMSHELKTPLSLIIAPLSKLMAEMGNGKQRDAVSAIHHNALRLNVLIHKILDFRQLEDEGENSLIRSHVELCALIQGCIDNFSTILEERQIHVEFDTTDVSAIWLNLDKLKIESVFINLISNAIKYVPKTEGHIKISIYNNEEKVCITISDNGTGIQESEIPLIFIRFFQGRNRLKHSDGTGIGLYLVKKFTELHNGAVRVWNNHGLTVEITLPTIGENAVQQTIESHFLPKSCDDENITLLIIDDNVEMVAFLAESLSGQYRCLTAYNGKEGLKMVQQQSPDLIIVDQMMPEMSGMEFCRQIRKNMPTASLPIIMLTAKDNMETELESIKVGVDVFIPKPFDMKKLILRITQLLQKKNLLEKSVRMETITRPDLSEKTGKCSPDELLMERITACIEENMNKEEFNVSMLAEMTAIDAKQLYRKIKQLTGMTPVCYIRKLRMKKAAILLAEKKFTVSEVVYLVGYTNASYFSKCFCEEFGVSPKQFLSNLNN